MSVSSNYALRLPASLKREVEKVAREDGYSLNQFIVTAVAEKLSALRTVEFFEERRKRADIPAALEFMSRKRGEKPREGDEWDR
jgi:Arc-like DNA binding domain